VFELSTGVEKVDIKVINASLTQNKYLQCVTPPLTHELRYRDRATPLNWTMTACMIRLGDVHYQSWNRTEFINFSERDLINDDSSFCSRILLAIDVQCHVFLFENLLLNVSLRL